MSAGVDIDWKATGYLASAGLVLAAAAKKMLTPFAVSQVREAMQPEFDKINRRLDELAADVAKHQRFQDFMRGKMDQ